MKNLFSTLFSLAALMISPCFGQTALTSTTLSTSVSKTAMVWNVASATGITAGTFLFTEQEQALVASVNGTAITLKSRGMRGQQVGHVTASTVYFGGLDSFINGPKQGSCTSTDYLVLPVIDTTTGTRYDCPTTAPYAGQWVTAGTGAAGRRYSDGVFAVDPGACQFTPTTYTQTTTFVGVGASSTPVINSTTNSTAGTDTMRCLINVPSRLTAGKGVTITDIDTYYGVQTTALTSLTTAISTITMPLPAATEVASTVTPVAISGTVTTNTVTSGLATTTAGAFWSVRSTLATPLAVNSDRTLIISAVGFVSSNSGVLTVNSPGLLVHYVLTE